MFVQKFPLAIKRILGYYLRFVKQYLVRLLSRLQFNSAPIKERCNPLTNTGMPRTEPIPPSGHSRQSYPCLFSKNPIYFTVCKTLNFTANSWESNPHGMWTAFSSTLRRPLCMFIYWRHLMRSGAVPLVASLPRSTITARSVNGGTLTVANSRLIWLPRSHGCAA